MCCVCMSDHDVIVNIRPQRVHRLSVRVCVYVGGGGGRKESSCVPSNPSYARHHDNATLLSYVPCAMPETCTAKVLLTACTRRSSQSSLRVCLCVWFDGWVCLKHLCVCVCECVCLYACRLVF